MRFAALTTPYGTGVDSPSGSIVWVAVRGNALEVARKSQLDQVGEEVLDGDDSSIAHAAPTLGPEPDTAQLIHLVIPPWA